MNSLFSQHSVDIVTACIIRVKGNAVSEKMAEECAQSCEDVGMPWAYWNAYDGYKDPIKAPAALEDHPLMRMLKVTDHYLLRGEVACALSHISLWAHCAERDRPIVILEHDALMVKPYLRHNAFNAIVYLGGLEQQSKGWGIYPIPPHASEGPNYHFICRAHAYAIDPAVARNLLAHVLKFGIHAPLDIMIRADVFNIQQHGLFAYDRENKKDTTILGRPLEGRSTARNDKLAA